MFGASSTLVIVTVKFWVPVRPDPLESVTTSASV
jgi:hypothetical protein